MEIKNNNNILEITTNSKDKVSFNTETKKVKIDDLEVSFPWEYEKSGILLEVKEYREKLFYSFSIEAKHLLIISDDDFEHAEEIYSFFWDVDILVIIWTKAAVKIFENIEARIVIPYGETKDLFLQSLGQNIEEQDSYKIKSELPIDNTEFVNLK